MSFLREREATFCAPRDSRMCCEWVCGVLLQGHSATNWDWEVIVFFCTKFEARRVPKSSTPFKPRHSKTSSKTKDGYVEKWSANSGIGRRKLVLQPKHRLKPSGCPPPCYNIPELRWTVWSLWQRRHRCNYFSALTMFKCWSSSQNWCLKSGAVPQSPRLQTDAYCF